MALVATMIGTMLTASKPAASAATTVTVRLKTGLAVLGSIIALLVSQFVIAEVAYGTPPGANGRLAFERYTEANDFQAQVGPTPTQ